VQSVPQSTYNAGQWEARLWPWAQPDLNYAAPEYILSRSCDLSSDMFSFGVLIYSIYNKGRPPFDCDNNMTAFKRNIEQVISRIYLKVIGCLPCASILKSVLVEMWLCDVYEKKIKYMYRTHFQMDGFTQRLVLTLEQKATQKWPICTIVRVLS